VLWGSMKNRLSSEDNAWISGVLARRPDADLE
jgi:hypothetical protein